MRFLPTWTALALTGMFAACVARADISGTVSLKPGDRFDFTAGTIVSVGGDILYDGSALAQQGSASALSFGPTTVQVYNGLTEASVVSYRANFQSGIPISPVMGWSFAVYTNGFLYAKIYISGAEASSVALVFTTFQSAPPNGPIITAVANSASNIPPGFPNSEIAQGAMFVVKGYGLGPAQAVVQQSFPLPRTLAGTSVKVSVGGMSIDCIMYYTLTRQVAAVLPSATPAGKGMLTLTYNDRTTQYPINVVPSNVGVFTLNQAGSGDAVASFQSDGTLITPINAPNPGEVIILWATGLGPVSGDESNAATYETNLGEIQLTANIGGKQARILYQGRNACCTAVDAILVAIPDGVSGCAVSVILETSYGVSNTSTIPVATSGRTCTPSNTAISQNQVQRIAFAGGKYRAGVVQLERDLWVDALTPLSQKADRAYGIFSSVVMPRGVLLGAQIDFPSFGSCTVSRSLLTNNPDFGTVVPVDAGRAIDVSGSNWQRSMVRQVFSNGLADYSALLDYGWTFLDTGRYAITSAGSSDIGPLDFTINIPEPFVWKEVGIPAYVRRSDDVKLTWSGGDPSGYAKIVGTSSDYILVGTFTCMARISDGQFTVPGFITSSLPAGLTGSLRIYAISAPVSFSASGVDVGTAWSAEDQLNQSVLFK
jgi:uncharacterized protein (TIGR03437 family)